jgi:hypothetical protein
LADPVGSPKHVSAEYYYQIPVRPIYKGYAIYAPGHEPPNYKAWLAQQEPQLLWGEDSNGTKHAPPLNTEADWITAGEMVFDAPIAFSTGSNLRLLGEPDYYEKTGIALAKGACSRMNSTSSVKKTRSSSACSRAPCATRASCPMAAPSRPRRATFRSIAWVRTSCAAARRR